MTLTKDVLVKLIKEELESIMAEQGEELEEVNPVDAEIAELEKQLAEAKMKKGKMSGKRAAGGMKMKGTTANVYDKNFGKKGVKKSSK